MMHHFPVSSHLHAALCGSVHTKRSKQREPEFVAMMQCNVKNIQCFYDIDHTIDHKKSPNYCFITMFTG